MYLSDTNAAEVTVSEENIYVRNLLTPETVVAVLSYSQSDHHCCGVYEISVTSDRTERCGYQIRPNVQHQNRLLRARKSKMAAAG